MKGKIASAADVDVVRAMLDGLFRGNTYTRTPVRELNRKDRRLIGKMYALAKKSRLSRCLAPGGCDAPAVGCHELQLRGPLKHLDDGTGHVLGFDSELSLGSPHKGERAGRIGVNEATVFTGLCSSHDTRLFKQIDTDPVFGTDEQLVLVWLRALLAEHFRRQRHIKDYARIEAFAASRREASAEIRLFTREMHNYAHWYAMGTEVPLLVWHRIGSEERIRTEAFALFAARVSPRASFACSGFFSPRWGLDGTRLGPRTLDERTRSMAFAVIPDEQGTLVVAVTLFADMDVVAPIFHILTERLQHGCLLETAWELGLRYAQSFVLAPTAWAHEEASRRRAVEQFRTACNFSEWQQWPGLPVPAVEPRAAASGHGV